MRILFVCYAYYPKPSANGVCVLRLQEALLSKGFNSDVICVGENAVFTHSDFGDVYCIKKSPLKNGWLSSFVNKIKIFFTWPVKDSRIIYSYIEAIKEMQKKHEYDCIVSVLRPIEGAIACSKFENVIVYELDSITNNDENQYGIRKFLGYRNTRIENAIYLSALRIFHLKCHETFYSNNKYDKFREKFEYTDIPHLVVKKRLSKKSSDDVVRFMFTGTLVKVRNSPEYAIKLFKECSKIIKVQCSFFSRGNCENLLAETNKVYPELIVPKGYVSQQELVLADADTDMYLSIGSHLTGSVTSVPSKIFEYMSTGKPIVHIASGYNDTAIEYLKKYANVLIVDPSDSLKENAKKLVCFVKEHCKTRIDIEVLRNILPMNTPEWTADRFVKTIKE